MGLDMYLTGKKYLSEYQDREKSQSEAIQGIVNTPFKVTEVSVQLGYWRKANQIHKWFVDATQNGEDRNGEDSYVTKEQLEELLGLVKEVLADHSKAGDLLPTQSGFFFGNTAYDEYYFNDLEDTKEILEKVLAWPEAFTEFDVYYHSSW